MSLPEVNCPYDIPEPYCWDSSFEVFYANLDEEHKGLFQGVFALTDKSKDINTSLSTLQTKVVDHFTDEEAMMEKAGYANVTEHKKIHADFVAILSPLSGSDVNDKVIKYAKEWLVEHIKTTDFKYKTKL
uniref:Hemerythrin n=1 Tax=Mesochaetopterus taylori TaxID=352254 RepID=A0A1S6QCN3_9ANNE|nr:hemerythrin [Mesochaetopterus taylori]